MSKADDVMRLRVKRYMTKGPGAKRSAPEPKPSIAQLKADVAKIGRTKGRKRK